MPKTRGQGQSKDATEWKERGIAAAISVNLQIFASRFANKPWAVYQHFDLNSGSGMNKEVGCIGSPLAFMQSVDDLGIKNYRAHFIDIERDMVKALQIMPGMDRNNCCLFHGDNKSLIAAIPDLIRMTDKPKFAIGTVLIDPNGADVPINELAWLSMECPKLDFIINWNSTIFKRLKGRKGRLEDLMEALNKKYWLIRKPVSVHQWTVLVGRNVKIGDHMSMGFHHLNSEIGQHIFKTCNYTKTEYSEILESANPQGELF